MSVAWCLGLLLALYVPLATTMAVVFVGLAVVSGNAKGFVEGEVEQLRDVVQHLQTKDAPPGVAPAWPEGVSYSLAAGMAVGHLGSLTYTLLLLRFGVGRAWARKVALRRPPVVPLVLSLLVLPGLIVVHSSFHLVLQKLVDADPGSAQTQLKAMLSPWPVWVAVLIIGVGPGVIEELFCRGFLGRGLVGRYGVVGGVLLTSILFGALHVDPLYALAVVPMGVFLHVIYLANQSLWVPMLLHFLNNTLAVVAVMVLDSDPTEEMPVAGYLLGFALTAAGLWALWSARGRLVPIDPELGQDEWRQAFPGVELPPERSGVTVRHRLPNPVAVLLTLTALGGLLYSLT